MDAAERREKLGKIQEQIRAWRNRAAMAWKQRQSAIEKHIKILPTSDLPEEAVQMTDLVGQALKRMWEYQIMEAEMEGREAPPPPPDPETFFKDWGDGTEGGPRWRPYDPSRVPKQPLPSSSGGEVALPLPKENEEG
ncbi:MAG: hypothetical protein C0469_13275 [Cyanobacteria bacterium DS2.3.42]|nr:hypothetical protein [Cyanobacteria bacterium DS2.3.42]